MLPKYYEFISRPKVISGYKALENVPFEFKKMGANRPLLITSKDFLKEGIVTTLKQAFHGSELTIGSVFSEIELNRPLETLDQVADAFKESACDSILAVGEDYTLETARSLAGMIIRMSAEVEVMDTLGIHKNHKIPFIAMPSVPGRRTMDKKLVNTDLHLTMSIEKCYMAEPDAIIIDPRATLNLSLKKTVACAIDTLCHAIEAFTGIQKNPMSDAYAVSAINLIRENVHKIVKNSRDRKARLGLANASILAEVSINNSMVGIVHALAYGVERLSRVSHEEAVCILLPHCMEYNRTSLDSEYGELLLPLAGPDIYADVPSHERGRKLIQTIRTLLMEYHDNYGLPICLTQIGIKRTDFEKIAEISLESGAIIYNSEDAKQGDLYDILNLAY